MATEALIRRYRNAYARLLRLYPKRHRERFGESMEQTFEDLCRERVKAEQALFTFALWMFLETSGAIVRENLKFIMLQKSIVRVAIGAGLLLLIPLVLTLLGKWQWNQPGVYVLAFLLLFASGLTYELVAKKMKNKAYRFAVGLAVGTSFVLSWMNLVRVVESENAANLLYYAVLAIGGVGAVLARFEPRGMARALFVTALSQVLIPMIVLFLWRNRPSPDMAAVFGVNAFFATLFVVSALLFRRAGASPI